MDLGLAGKTALITGSTKGIGKAIAELLYAEGCRVVFNARDIDSLTGIVAKHAGAVGIQGDVSNPKQAKKVVNGALEAFGALDILVCNVGSGRSVSPGRETFDEWNRVFAINLWSTTNTVEAAKEALIYSRGCIVCISSICGMEVVPSAPITYSAAKSALHAYVRGIARPFGAHGVRINAVAPGNISFDGSAWEKRMSDDKEGVEDMLRSEVSLGRLGKVEDVANLVAYLASPTSGFATGQVWTVDGGQTRAQ